MKIMENRIKKLLSPHIKITIVVFISSMCVSLAYLLLGSSKSLISTQSYYYSRYISLTLIFIFPIIAFFSTSIYQTMRYRRIALFFISIPFIFINFLLFIATEFGIADKCEANNFFKNELKAKLTASEYSSLVPGSNELYCPSIYFFTHGNNECGFAINEGDFLFGYEVIVERVCKF
jgi:hypothetical protein